MTATNFDAALQIILVYEGGYSDDPADPGGSTQCGVTLNTFSNYLRRQATVAELKAITNEQLAAIYRSGYWGAICDALPSGVDLIYFDGAIQHGPGKIAKFLQNAVGVTADGMVGHLTLAAANAANPSDTIRSISNQRDTFYRSLGTFAKFGKGWTARLNDVTARSYGWANLAAHS